MSLVGETCCRTLQLTALPLLVFPTRASSFTAAWSVCSSLPFSGTSISAAACVIGLNSDTLQHCPFLTLSLANCCCLQRKGLPVQVGILLLPDEVHASDMAAHVSCSKMSEFIEPTSGTLRRSISRIINSRPT